MRSFAISTRRCWVSGELISTPRPDILEPVEGDPEYETVPWLWGADVELGWVFMRFNVVPITTRVLAPGSYSYGLGRLPTTGGGVLAVNHLSAIDPPLVGSFSNRAIFYMAKHEILRIPIIGAALTWTGGFLSAGARATGTA